MYYVITQRSAGVGLRQLVADGLRPTEEQVLYIRIYIHTHIHTYVYTYTHTYIRIYIHTYIHTYVYTYTHTYIQCYTYTHTYVHIRPHTIHTLRTPHPCTARGLYGVRAYVYVCMCVSITDPKSHDS